MLVARFGAQTPGAAHEGSGSTPVAESVATDRPVVISCAPEKLGVRGAGRTAGQQLGQAAMTSASTTSHRDLHRESATSPHRPAPGHDCTAARATGRAAPRPSSRSPARPVPPPRAAGLRLGRRHAGQVGECCHSRRAFQTGRAFSPSFSNSPSSSVRLAFSQPRACCRSLAPRAGSAARAARAAERRRAVRPAPGRPPDPRGTTKASAKRRAAGRAAPRSGKPGRTQGARPRRGAPGLPLSHGRQPAVEFESRWQSRTQSADGRFHPGYFDPNSWPRRKCSSASANRPVFRRAQARWHWPRRDPG